MDGPLGYRVEFHPMKRPPNREEALSMHIDNGVLLSKMGFGPKPAVEFRAATTDGYAGMVPIRMLSRLVRLAWRGYQAARSVRRGDAACSGVAPEA